ncbi:uncharacterized protein LOC105840680 [Monomorium pharaonis]|uniref:uncharacterized protein LOC105840680 n=1 Tax=Monomorium pharaonis TaxID=307658 RepID=UPI00063F83D6|nr:uncharacterized protein LOC105840680 [Monomorium pharaonis]
MMLCGVTTGRTPEIEVRIQDSYIRTKKVIKYLGIWIDHKWEFREHLKAVVPKAEKISQSLARLMPNLKGPSERCRHLYAEVAYSVLMYGSPIWADNIFKFKKVKAKIKALQRRVDQRIIMAYRTVSYEASVLLARMIPIELIAGKHSRVFFRMKTIRMEGGVLTPSVRRTIRKEKNDGALEVWRIRLEQSDPDAPGKRIRDAIGPFLLV